MEIVDQQTNQEEEDKKTDSSFVVRCFLVRDIFCSPLRQLSISPSGEYVLAIETASGKNSQGQK